MKNPPYALARADLRVYYVLRVYSRRVVWCLDGDGAALMHLGSLALSAGLPNLRHVLLNNNVHDSVGGQRTVASQPLCATDGVSTASAAASAASAPPILQFSRIARAAGYAETSTASTAATLDAALTRLISRREVDGSASAGAEGLRAAEGGASFLEVEIELGTRSDLGRPKKAPADTKARFMSNLAT